MKYNVIIPEQHFWDLTEDEMSDIYDSMKHAPRRVDVIIEEIEEEESQ